MILYCSFLKDKPKTDQQFFFDNLIPLITKVDSHPLLQMDLEWSKWVSIGPSALAQIRFNCLKKISLVV